MKRINNSLIFALILTLISFADCSASQQSNNSWSIGKWATFGLGAIATLTTPVCLYFWNKNRSPHIYYKIASIHAALNYNKKATELAKDELLELSQTYPSTVQVQNEINPAIQLYNKDVRNKAGCDVLEKWIYEIYNSGLAADNKNEIWYKKPNRIKYATGAAMSALIACGSFYWTSKK